MGKEEKRLFLCCYKCLYEGGEEITLIVSAASEKRNPNVLPEGKEKYHEFLAFTTAPRREPRIESRTSGQSLQ